MEYKNEEKLSECCGSSMYDDYDICLTCGENTIGEIENV